MLTGPPFGLRGTLTPGALVTFVIYAQQYLRPIIQFGNVVDDYEREKAAGSRVYGLMTRTILKDPAILVLDEATSHVDIETEVLIRRSLSASTRDRTTFVIAHRLSTASRADRIVVLDGGEIAERGTHDELIAADGLYANFWRVQAGAIDELPEEFLEPALRRGAEIDPDGDE